jgi:hypothetical protein
MHRLDGKVALVSGAARGIGDGGETAAETNGGSLTAMLGPNGVFSNAA